MYGQVIVFIEIQIKDFLCSLIRTTLLL